jgi:hypothetical protein
MTSDNRYLDFDMDPIEDIDPVFRKIRAYTGNNADGVFAYYRNDRSLHSNLHTAVLFADQ